jgi:hypothetical protein
MNWIDRVTSQPVRALIGLGLLLALADTGLTGSST